VCIVAALCIAGVLWASVALASITISPPLPSADDSVRVNVGIGFSMMCWSPGATRCDLIGGNTLRVAVEIQYCGGHPTCNCLMVPIGFVRTCNFGPLPEGSYVAEFIVTRLNPDDPLTYPPQFVNFNVGGPTPALRRTWGALKQIYR